MTRKPSLRLSAIAALAVCLVPCIHAAPVRRAAVQEAAVQAAAVQSSGQEHAVYFEENLGQAGDSVAFVARARGMSILVERGELVLLRHTDRSMLRMSFPGSNPRVSVEGEELLRGTINLLRGRDPGAWVRGIPTYARVRMLDLFESVDLLLYESSGSVEMDLILAPGVDPCNRSGLDQRARGCLRRWDGRAPAGDTWWFHDATPPLLYQDDAKGRTIVSGDYEVEAAGDDLTLRFKVHCHDPSRPLVIDPVITSSTYFGGTNVDEARSIAVDSAGAAYITGFTDSMDFPTTPSYQSTHSGVVGFSDDDAFVSKFDASGSLVYSTYLGGRWNDLGLGIAVDSTGAAVVVGETSSTDFPVQAGIQATYGGQGDAFVTKLSPSGGSIVYSTLLGDFYSDKARAVTIDSADNAIVVGDAGSQFPLVNPIQATTSDNWEGFVAKFPPGSGFPTWCTYLGGNSRDLARAVATGPGDDVFVAGETGSDNFPLVNPFQAVRAGSWDAFVTRINAAGTQLVYSTFLGSTHSDRIHGIAVDATGTAFVHGEASSNTFPQVNPFQPVGINGDIFCARLSAAGNNLLWSSFMGGGFESYPGGITLDRDGNPVVAGSTRDVAFPTKNPLQASKGGGVWDCYVAKLDAGGAGFLFSSYLGAEWDDHCSGIGIDASGEVVLCGWTGSNNFPTVNPWQPASAGNWDTFVTRIAWLANIVSVQSGVTAVSAGQTGIAVTVAIENPSSYLADVTTVDLDFTDIMGVSVNQDYNVTPAPGNPTSIAASSTASFSFTVDVVAMPTQGRITVDASCSVTYPATMQTCGDDGAASPHSWSILGPCSTSLCGDCNNDGSVNILDALLAAQHAGGVLSLTGTQFSNCNVTGAVQPNPASQVSILDALVIAQSAAGLPVVLTCC